ncbi:MAG: DNA repair protein RecO [Candidatus Yonathbacteria bacterium]|nr:DNA repair protein RecO [Candidatus Yonathbacteria bacterium]
MSHTVYHTEGIVLSSINVGESNRFLFILTKDLGLLGVVPQGVRELKSKLRYSMSTLSHTYIDLVRGKEVWRATNTQSLRSFSSLVNDKEKIALYARLSSFLRRLMPGESAHERLFEEFLSGIGFLEQEKMNTEELRSFEALMVLRILNQLGYWGEMKKFEEFLDTTTWSRKELLRFSHVRIEANKYINQALKESHL